MTKLSTADLQAMLAGITPGPWQYHRAPRVGGGFVHCTYGNSSGVTVGSISSGQNSDRIDDICAANARAIAQVPALIAEVLALRVALSRVVALETYPGMVLTGRPLTAAIESARNALKWAE